jgi:hypothetical protein
MIRKETNPEALSIIIQTSRQNRTSALSILAAIVFFYAVFIAFIIFTASNIFQ